MPEVPDCEPSDDQRGPASDCFVRRRESQVCEPFKQRGPHGVVTFPDLLEHDAMELRIAELDVPPCDWAPPAGQYRFLDRDAWFRFEEVAPPDEELPAGVLGVGKLDC